MKQIEAKLKLDRSGVITLMPHDKLDVNIIYWIVSQECNPPVHFEVHEKCSVASETRSRELQEPEMSTQVSKKQGPRYDSRPLVIYSGASSRSNRSRTGKTTMKLDINQACSIYKVWTELEESVIENATNRYKSIKVAGVFWQPPAQQAFYGLEADNPNCVKPISDISTPSSGGSRLPRAGPTLSLHQKIAETLDLEGYACLLIETYDSSARQSTDGVQREVVSPKSPIYQHHRKTTFGAQTSTSFKREYALKQFKKHMNISLPTLESSMISDALEKLEQIKGQKKGLERITWLKEEILAAAEGGHIEILLIRWDTSSDCEVIAYKYEEKLKILKDVGATKGDIFVVTTDSSGKTSLLRTNFNLSNL